MRLTKPQVFAGAVLVSWACSNQSAQDPGSYTPPGTTGGSSTHPGTGGSSVQSGSGGSFTTGGSSSASGGTSAVTGGASGTGGNETGSGNGGMHVTPATGGSTTGAGRNGTGGTNARAGGPGTGGTNGLGGVSSSGGSAGTSPITGTTGGSMGAAGVPSDPNWKPPDMTATAPLIVFYQTSNAMAMSSDIQIMMSLKNQTDTAYDLSKVTIRYWMSSEPPPVFSIYYQSTGLNLSKTIQFMPNMADSYILFSFGKGGTVAPYVDQNSLNNSQISAGVQGASGINAMFNQANDWSFDATASMPKANPKITLYDGDTLIWGCEPTHVCAEPPAMTGGGAGATGQGGSP
jgi:hypothetical protein